MSVKKIIVFMNKDIDAQDNIATPQSKPESDG
jgi:hypothetical protein